MNLFSRFLRKRRKLTRILALTSMALNFSAPLSPLSGQTSNQTIRTENDYRECLYSKAKSGGYKRGERDSDFALIAECRNQWVAYIDVCTKLGLDNGTCVMKSRLLIHAILELVGK